MKRVKEPVPLEECKRRALSYLLKDGGLHTFTRPSCVAASIWPGVEFRAQGAGAAASRILRRLIDDGLVVCRSSQDDWGYQLTSAGRLAAAREAK